MVIISEEMMGCAYNRPADFRIYGMLCGKVGEDLRSRRENVYYIFTVLYGWIWMFS